MSREQPECIVLTPVEVKGLGQRKVKGDKVSHWLQPRQYETEPFREGWGRIGSGLSPVNASEEKPA